MNIDDIKYGNPAKSHIERVKADVGGLLKSAMDLGIIDDIITNHKFPANSSDETKKELEYLVQLTKHADDDIIKYCQLMESHHYDLFVVVGKRLGLDVTKEQILKWVSDVDPITFYLKDKFNRPRPYQLGNALNIPLYPVIVTDADSAAYPSGHTMDFLVILYHFGKMKPELAGKLSEFYETIKNVREISGLHYPSDRKCSEYLFKQLVKNNLIK
jgi:acid phosphatase (class A)